MLAGDVVYIYESCLLWRNKQLQQHKSARKNEREKNTQHAPEQPAKKKFRTIFQAGLLTATGRECKRPAMHQWKGLDEVRSETPYSSCVPSSLWTICLEVHPRGVLSYAFEYYLPGTWYGIYYTAVRRLPQKNKIKI